MRSVFVLLMLTLLSSGCSTVTPGMVTVKVSVCGESADRDRYTVIHSGRYWSGPCTEYYKIPAREQRAVWTQDASEGSPTDQSIMFAGVDGQALNIDVGVGYIIDTTSDELILTMVRTYGPNLDLTIDGKVRDVVRDSLNTCASEGGLVVQDIYGAKKGELMSCAQKRTQDAFSENGLIITRVTLNSDVRLPERIKNAMQEAQAATQKADQAERELDLAIAEGAKRQAAADADAAVAMTRAKAEADANRMITTSLTPEVIRLRELEIQLEQAKRWDGKLPQTVMGAEVPMIMMQK